MAADFNIKQNDTRPTLVATLTAAATDVFTSVVFKMSSKAGVIKVNSPAGIQTQPSASSGGVVKYPWVAGDTDTPGDFRGEFTVTFSDGRVETYPNRGYIAIHIEQALS